MGRKRFDNMNCGIAQALEAIGDWWTLLVIRDAFFGIRRFSDFQASLGIAKNILSDRLLRLVEHGILSRVDAGDTGQRYEYELTEKGESLLPVLIALREWSDRWVFGAGREPIIVTDRRTGRRVQKLKIRAADGRELKRRDLRAIPGPGADEEVTALLDTRRQRSGD